jgi:hypothetical protein
MLKELEKISDEMNELLSQSQSQTGIDIQYVLLNYEKFKSIIGTLNQKYLESRQNVLDKIIFSEFIKQAHSATHTIEKLIKLSNDILSPILSQQIILTNNNLQTKYKLIDIDENDDDDIKLEKIILLSKILGKKNIDEIKEFVANANSLILENEQLKTNSNLSKSITDSDIRNILKKLKLKSDTKIIEKVIKSLEFGMIADISIDGKTPKEQHQLAEVEIISQIKSMKIPQLSNKNRQP